MKTYRSLSSEQTQALGEAIAKKMVKAPMAAKVARKHAIVFALQGDLGAGKTTFVQGFLKGLGLKKRAQSPTFIIMRRHRLSRAKTGFENIFHIDAYRLSSAEQLRVLEFHEILMNPHNVILIEWPERIKRILPKTTQRISFRHGKKENERSITVK